MRRFFKIAPFVDDLGNQLIRVPTLADDLAGITLWCGLPPQREFVDQFNNNVVLNSFSATQMFGSLRLVVWAHDVAFHNNPDFSGYSSWLTMNKSTSNPQGVR